jgi:serine protease AprX
MGTRVAYGVSWNDSKKGRLMAASLAVVLAFSLMTPAQRESLAATADRMVSVIVRELPGAGNAPERAVQATGGEVTREIGIINGFSAKVPVGTVGELRELPYVHSVTPDAKLKLLDYDDPTEDTAEEAGVDRGSMYDVQKATRTREAWRRGYLGQGVDVALIDSGVVPVEGLTTPGKVINGPDLSFESQDANTQYLDTYGHGTHMAGIIAGLDNGVDPMNLSEKRGFLGVAPYARLLNVKVANAQGATDVSQVLAAIDWVVQHRNDNGMNVRVMNLSFGTDGTQSYLLDPLTYAVEVAWHKGIVVVVAAGNSQFGTSALNNPAYDPYVIAAGANDTKGTYYTDDDTIPDWSARGDGLRNPDFVAPGKSVLSLRNPGSHIDLANPSAVVKRRLFKGSGTSQAAAAVSGAAAILLSQRPSLTPDQVKGLLTKTANPLPAADVVAQGSGMLDVRGAVKKVDNNPTLPSMTQRYPKATGAGSLQLARGSGVLLSPDGVGLTGEKDIFGATWEGNSWSGNSWSGNSWSGGIWNGNSWSGNSWSGNSWSGNSWSGNSWSGNSWSGNSWSGNSWSGNSWSGNSWSGNSWSGNSWSGNSWSGNSWSGNSWSGNSWS